MSGSDVAELFRQMADRIEKNAEEFGGVLLAVPPPDPQSGQIQAVDVLLITPSPDIANYWTMAQGKIQIAAAVFEEQARAKERMGFR